MGMSKHVLGFKPAGEKHDKMVAAYRACTDLGIELPNEVDLYFAGEPPDETGVPVSLSSSHSPSPGVSEYDGGTDACEDGYEVNLDELDQDIRIIRFVCSY